MNREYRLFIFIVLLTVIIPLVFVLLVNLAVDPYDYFHSPQYRLTKVKVSLETQQRLHKAIEIARQKPEAIFLGSSRLMAGLDPTDFHQLTGLKAYNGGFSGASMDEIEPYFEHALFHQPNLKVVIIGLDVFLFNKNKQPQKDFSLNRLKQGTFDLKSTLALLMSKTALINSFKTLQANYSTENAPRFLPHGLYNPAVVNSPQNEYLVKGDAAYLKMIFESKDFYMHYAVDDRKIDAFKRIAKKCKEKGILLKAFFCPAKAIYWKSLYQNGLQPIIEELKKNLSQIHPIWDFSGFNCVTLETLQNADSPLYYECSHFRPCVGRMILHKMWGTTSDPEDFGRLYPYCLVGR